MVHGRSIAPGTGSSPKPCTLSFGSWRCAARRRNAALPTARAPEPLVWEERGKEGHGWGSTMKPSSKGAKKYIFFSAQVSMCSICVCPVKSGTTRVTRDSWMWTEPWASVCLSGRDTKLDPHPASQPHPARTSPVAVPSPAPPLPGGPAVGGKMLPRGRSDVGARLCSGEEPSAWKRPKSPGRKRGLFRVKAGITRFGVVKPGFGTAKSPRDGRSVPQVLLRAHGAEQ